MKKLLSLGLLLALFLQPSFGQEEDDEIIETEELKHCGCQDEIEWEQQGLNGFFARTCGRLLNENGEFVDGKKSGVWIGYSTGGQKIRKVNYEAGVLNGQMELFYLSGRTKLRADFADGSKTGDWNFYNKKGRVIMNGYYEEDQPIEAWTIYDKEGVDTLVQYDFTTKQYVYNDTNAIEDLIDSRASRIKNLNTGKPYVISSQDFTYPASPIPLGGYELMTYLFSEVIEIPVTFWDTYHYAIYKVNLSISEEGNYNFTSVLFDGELPEEHLDMAYIASTYPPV
jgi:hypothetical protein